MGTSDGQEMHTLGGWDHPHAYGDKTKVPCGAVLVCGSSPRVWGQEKAGGKTNGKGRIIPTRMGTSVIYTIL